MLCLLLVERKKETKKKKVKQPGWLFPQGQTRLAGCAVWDFHGCWVQLRDDLRVSL
jgi:hypothetical protein